MIRELFRVLSSHSALDDVLRDFAEMLDTAKAMLEEASSIPFEGADPDEFRQKFYDKDKHINKLEQKIRRRIVTHLAVTKGGDLPISLVMISLVKDAERIGDYAKNLFQVFEKAGKLEEGPYYSLVVEARDYVSTAIDAAKSAFMQGDRDAARKLIRENFKLEKRFDQAVWELMDIKVVCEQRCRQPVAYALLFRFYKRILRHLSNILTAVVMPIDKLDYFDE